MPFVPSTLNIHFVTKFIQNEAKYGDNSKTLLLTYQESQPQDLWEGLDDKEIIALARQKKQTVSKQLTRHRLALQETSYVTNGYIVEELDEAREMAKGQKDPGVMIKATMSKAQTVGLLVSRHEYNNKVEISVKHAYASIPQEFKNKLEGLGASLPNLPDNIIDVNPE